MYHNLNNLFDRRVSVDGLDMPMSPVKDLRSPTTEEASKEAYKGPWSDAEDELLRRYAEIRNANPTACDSSNYRCRSLCVEGVCAHHWCTEEDCYHSRCTDHECLASNHVHRRPVPRGPLIMVPLKTTLCRHLINTEKLWTEIANLVSTACGRIRNAKQCRERWFQQLRPGLITSLPIQAEEGELIMQLVREKGPKWADISRHPRLQRRSDNCIKNWWNSSGNKKDRAEKGVQRCPKRFPPGDPKGRWGPEHSKGIHRNRPTYPPSRPAATLNQIYQHAVENTYQTQLPPIEPALRSAPLPQLKSPLCSPNQSSYGPPLTCQPHSGSYFPSAISPAGEHYLPQSSPMQYHGRRRESTASVITSPSTISGSGPNTPSTSKSFFTGTSVKPNIVPPPFIPTIMSAPKDTRMSISSLCT